MTTASARSPVILFVGPSDEATRLAKRLEAAHVLIGLSGMRDGATLVANYSLPELDMNAVTVRSLVERLGELAEVMGRVPRNQSVVIESTSWMSPNPEWLSRSVLHPLGRSLTALIWVKGSALSDLLSSNLPILGRYVSLGTRVVQINGSVGRQDSPNVVAERILTVFPRLAPMPV